MRPLLQLTLASALLLLPVLLLAGCSGLPIHGKDGTVHYLIVGLGVVSTPTTNRTAAVVTDVRALGLSVTDGPGLKCALGYGSSTTVRIPDNAADVRIQASRHPFAPLQVQVDAARHDQVICALAGSR
jgi:hypothetical protein